jgi:hypothetical protein
MVLGDAAMWFSTVFAGVAALAAIGAVVVAIYTVRSGQAFTRAESTRQAARAEAEGQRRWLLGEQIKVYSEYLRAADRMQSSEANLQAQWEVWRDTAKSGWPKFVPDDQPFRDAHDRLEVATASAQLVGSADFRKEAWFLTNQFVQGTSIVMAVAVQIHEWPDFAPWDDWVSQTAERASRLARLHLLARLEIHPDEMKAERELEELLAIAPQEPGGDE